MSQFLILLSAYYACDAAATAGALDRETVVACAETYESVKVHFLTEDERRQIEGAAIGATGSAAYLRFKDWEAENADLVAQMKAEARAMLAADA